MPHNSPLRCQSCGLLTDFGEGTDAQTSFKITGETDKEVWWKCQSCGVTVTKKKDVDHWRCTKCGVKNEDRGTTENRCHACDKARTNKPPERAKETRDSETMVEPKRGED